MGTSSLEYSCSGLGFFGKTLASIPDRVNSVWTGFVSLNRVSLPLDRSVFSCSISRFFGNVQTVLVPVWELRPKTRTSNPGAC